MSTYGNQLREAVRTIRILSPTSFEWRTASPTRVRIKRRDIRDGLLLRTLLRDQLKASLYEGFYKKGGIRGAAPVAESNGGSDGAFVAAMSRLNHGTGGWEPGWIVRDAGGQLLTIERLGFKVRARPEECRMPAVVTVDDEVELRYQKERRHNSPGFYVALGNTPVPTGEPLVRLYWNPTSAGALLLVAELTHRLNERGLPFHLKSIDHPSRYGRCDAVVMYFPASGWKETLAEVAAVYPRVSAEMQTRVPAFALRLAAGLGIAEDPGGGESFGGHRCALLAEGLLRAYEAGARGEDRLEVVRDCFEEGGVDPDRPYQHSLELDKMTVEPFRRSPQAPTVRRTGTDDFIETAASIGRQLSDTAIWADGMCNWIGATDQRPGDERTYSSLDAHLYSGTSGIGLFLAHLAVAHSSDAASVTAIGALRHALWSARSRAATPDPGLYTGILGVAIAAERVARLVGDEDLRSSARRLVDEWLRSGGPHHDPGFDLISGRAGVIIGLLALNAAWRDDELVAAARAHGEALIKTARRTDEGDSWESPDIPAERDLTGLSHGASGPAWALGELAAATGERVFREGAGRALQYETACFDPIAGNWPDFRTRSDGFDPAPSATLWCHGATGIGLARLRLAELLEDPSCARDARLAMSAVKKAVKRALPDPRVDWSLCHGITGNADALLTAARSSESAAYLHIARCVGKAASARLERWIGAGANGTPIGMMSGLAGIGLFCLRLCDDRIPSVQMLSPEILSPSLSV